MEGRNGPLWRAEPKDKALDISPSQGWEIWILIYKSIFMSKYLDIHVAMIGS